MTYFSFVDNNDLLASQLNGNFNQAANLSVGTTQTFAGPIVAPSITMTGAVINAVTTVTASGGYTVVGTDYLIKIKKTVAATTAITLPTSPTTGRTLIIKDGAGNASAFNITINGGAILIDAATSLVLNQPYASVTLIFDGTSWCIT